MRPPLIRRLTALVATLLAVVLLDIPTATHAAAPERSDRPPLVNVKEPRILGEARYGQVLTAARGRWRPGPDRVRFQWLRDGKPIKGATGKRFAIRVRDVGHRIGLSVSVKAEGHRWTSRRTKAVRGLHRVPVRRTVKYSVRVKGKPAVNLASFKRLAQQTYNDPRGWRGRGVRFARVAHGGGFTLWISEPGLVPSFSSGCSAEWSCRVGRNVVINALRWNNASPSWNAAGGSLRNYRHMVVNHETGHWLGYGHAACPGKGQPAPVMMQQSKTLAGCRFNPWPTLAELRR